MPFLSHEMCTHLLAEIRRASNVTFLTRPNSMNNYGFLLREVGYGPWLDGLLDTALKPLGSSLFPLWGGTSLDSEHSFTISYR